jgi:hypothetical protein
MDEITEMMRMLSSKRVMERRIAIRLLKARIRSNGDFLATLSLRYVSEHDPCYTVRNIARQALYSDESAPDEKAVWDKAYSFHRD